MSRVCNICGRKFDMYDANEDYNITWDLGYGTKYDGKYLDLHICCDCMEKLIDNCKVSPIAEQHKKPRSLTGEIKDLDGRITEVLRVPLL